MVVFAQFGGNPCDGVPGDTRPCQTTQQCPLGDGCRNRFRCGSDQDCEEDNLDERTCDVSLETYKSCASAEQPPPNIQNLGLGFDAVTGMERGMVINTVSFGGQCRPVQGLTGDSVYRMPLSTLSYKFAKVEKDFSEEVYSSKWEYAKTHVVRETVTGTTTGYKNYDFHDKQTSDKYIPISEEFWKALGALPVVYDYATYSGVLERFGTHYRSEGTVGGYVKAVMYRSEDNTTTDWTTINVQSLLSTDVKGGLHITELYNLNLRDTARNWKAYSDWADSVTSLPVVTKQKLVKGVACAGVKKLHLHRAIEQYVAQTHPCHCQPCRNNGVVVRDGRVCRCVCKPGTKGLACEQGSELEGQAGVIHGSWSCWSPWTSCSSLRSRRRACSNPAPRNGGLHCIGAFVDTSECVGPELAYLRTMEPECFDFSMAPRKKCSTPPALLNGFVLDPRDVHLVGNRVEYRCINEYYLEGNPILECMEDQTWSQHPGYCRTSKCMSAVLSDGVTASPWKGLYSIGERVTLSCPPGKQILGGTVIICDPSLHFSPSPASIHCSKGTSVTAPPTIECPPGEKSSRGRCVCRSPSECRLSLEVCVVLSQRAPMLLSVCKLHSLQCLGKGHTLVENSACQWPEMSTAEGCDSCRIWEVCDAQTNTCRCKEACSDPGVSVCVRVGDDLAAPATPMGECEAGRRKCGGERVAVVSLRLPCGSL
ncbi:hypothetical protein NHX12_028214 [Muraenolepis orangiensis]|uniref:Complement component C7 n=1 Tax=Muraenolepis orangiensis TaxID=630683 RepID=A0A9Q0EDA9_9TELE|nr:hypothetical protein NHX12_028214 [Muraenolepis orangiensis]